LNNALNLVGIHIDSLNDDVARLNKSFGDASARVAEGFKNNQRVQKEIADAEAKAEQRRALQKLSPAERERIQLFLGEGSTAGTPDAANPNVPQNATVKAPPRKPDTSGASKAAAAARKEAADLLKILQLGEKEAELANTRITATLRNALADRIISLEDYTQRSIDQSLILLKVQLDALDQEEKAAIKTAKTPTEVKAKQAEFNLKRLAAQQAADLKYFELTDDLRRKQEQAEIDHQARLFAIADVFRKATEAATRSAVQQGAISNQEGEARVLGLERQRFNERRTILEAELKAKQGNLQDAQRINDELAKLAAERAAFEEDAERRTIDAIQKTIDTRQKFLDQQIRLNNEIQRGAVDALSRQAGALETKAGVNPVFGDASKLARQQADFAAEDLLNKERVAAILADEQTILSNKLATDEEKVVATQQANARLEQEEQRHADAMGIIQANVVSPLVQIQNILKQTAGAFGETAIAALASGQAIGGAMKAMAAAVLKQIASIAIGQAIKNFAYGLEALGIIALTGNPSAGVAAGHFFGAAALWGGLAVGAALGAGALSKSGGAAGGAISGGGGRGTTTGSSTDPRVIDQGGPLPNRDQKPQIIVIRTEVGEGTVVRHWMEDARNNGVVRGTVQQIAGTG
jgi:hypothetical protein